MAEAGIGTFYLLFESVCHNMPGLLLGPQLAFICLTMKNHTKQEGNLHCKDASLCSAFILGVEVDRFLISASQPISGPGEELLTPCCDWERVGE